MRLAGRRRLLSLGAVVQTNEASVSFFRVQAAFQDNLDVFRGVCACDSDGESSVEMC